MPTINLQGPASFGAINSVISQYATPDAAESDLFFNAPRGRNFLVDRYRQLTGDYFADPFEDARQRYADRRMAEVVAAKQAATVPSAFSNASGTQLSPWAAREVTNQTIRDQLASEANARMLESREMQLPAIGAENYQDIQKRRSNYAGVANLFDEIAGRQPEALAPADEGTPAMLQRLETTGKNAGKVQPSYDLHPIAFNPKFQETLRREPEKAIKFYHAVTGRSFETDRAATVAQRAEFEKADDEILADLRKTGKWNPILGTFTKSTMQQDPNNPFGPYREIQRPISDVEEAALRRKGGALQALRVDPSQVQPKFDIGVAAKGLTPMEEKAFRVKLDQWAQTNPEADLKQGMNVIYNDFMKRQREQAKLASPNTASAPGSVPGQPGDKSFNDNIFEYLRWADFTEPFRNALPSLNPSVQQPAFMIAKTGQLLPRQQAPLRTPQMTQEEATESMERINRRAPGYNPAFPMLAWR
jgi:hypothetical protein